MNSSSVNSVDRRSVFLATGQISACGGAMYAVASPFLVLFGERFGVGEAQQGNAIAAFFGAFTLISIMLPFGLRALAWRTVATVFVCITAAGMGSLILVQSFRAAFPLMGLVGFGMGGLYTLAITIFGASEQPDRAMGIKIFLETVPGMILCYTLPVLGAAYGFAGGVALMLGFAMLTALAIPFVPNRGAKILTGGSHFRPGLAAIVVCLGTFCTAISSFGAWTFLAQIASAQGISTGLFAPLLAAGFLMTGVGALTAAWLGDRIGRALPIVIATVLDVLAILAIFAGRSDPLFVAGVLGWGFLNQVILVYQMGFVAEVDNTGRVVGFISAALSAGAVVGPLIAGHLLEALGPSSIRWFTLITIALASGTYFVGKSLALRVRAFERR